MMKRQILIVLFLACVMTWGCQGSPAPQNVDKTPTMGIPSPVITQTPQQTPQPVASTDGPFRTTSTAEVSIQAEPVGFTVQCLNTGQETIALAPLGSRWGPYWSIEVFDAKGNAYGLPVPPAAAIPLTPEQFKLLKPGESSKATYSFSHFMGVDRSTGNSIELEVPTRVEASYIFQTSDVSNKLKTLELHGSQSLPDSEDSPASKDWTEVEKKAWQDLFKAAPFLLPVSGEATL
jgi:hypothetical protein